MRRCALCCALITAENDSEEHLILNAIGGRLKVPGVLCRSCNSQAGDSWDAELAKQLNSLSLLFGVTRERGTTPSQDFKTVGGQELKLHASGTASPSRPTYEEEATETGIRINLIARDVREARRMLKGVAKKYPQADVHALLANARQISTYTDDHLHFPLSFGGPLAGRSLVKSALCLAVSSGVDPRACEGARDYLSSDQAVPCFGYYYERDLLLKRPEDTVLHCVAVQGSAATGLLLGYVELYGVLRVVVRLSGSYGGPEVRTSYAINPITGEETTVEIDLSLTAIDVEAAFRYERMPPGSVEDAFAKVLPIALVVSYEREKNRVLHEAVEYAFKNCGALEGETLTAEHITRLSELVAEKMALFMDRHARR